MGKPSSLQDETLFQTWITRIVINESHTLLRQKRKYLLQSTVYRQTDTRIPDPELRYMIDQLPEKNLPAAGAALLGRIYLPANRQDAPCYAGHGCMKPSEIKNAFAHIPDACVSAIMAAVDNAKEESVIKKELSMALAR